jgi:3-phenylpropionate/trans-cinnamate dioxygenase ferredoxin reductase component
MVVTDKNQRCVVIGASHAGSQLAIHLRKSGWQGEIVLIGAEAVPPYHRPPLSKAVLSGNTDIASILLRPAAMYHANSIDLRLATRAEAILPDKQQLLLATGEAMHYDKLALCTGARPIKLPLGDGLAGVFYLRSIEDVMAIRRCLSDTRRAVIIGAGYIGLEAAAVLSALGVDVTVLEREERVLKRVAGEQVSQYFTDLHTMHGVKVVCGAEVIAINGQGGVDSVHCSDGTEYNADMVIIGVGVVPETGLAQNAGLRVENGIWVDEFARTSDENVYAAGDCTSHPSALYKRRIRLESVQNANDQSRVAAVNICGESQRYQMIPWFWSDQYDIKLQSVGLANGYDEIALEGSLDPADGSGFVLQYFCDGKLIAADCVSRSKDFMTLKAAIQASQLPE